MVITPLACSLIDESPTNPRKFFDPVKLAELAGSIREKGVQQPIKVRPKGKRYELVFGARRLRASKEAGLKEIPGVVEDLSDLEVLEAQIIENGQRADVHPLEECDAYVALHDMHKRTVPEIAAKVGKSPSYVYQRMALRNLGETGRKAFAEGTIDAGVALVLARISDPEAQKRATEEVVRGWNGVPLRAREAQQLVHERFMLKIAGAPFDTKSAELVPEAGACTNCPKRTANARELFADVTKDDLCTDSACFKQKSEASWSLVRKAAEAKGARVLSEKEAKKVWPYNITTLDYSSDYVSLDDKDHYDKKQRTYRQIIGKESVQVVIARDPSGKVRELVEKKELKKVLNAKGAAVSPALAGRSASGSHGSKESRDAAKQAKERAEQSKLYRARVITAIVEKADKDGSSPAFWRTLARAAGEAAGPSALGLVAERRGVELKKGSFNAGKKWAESFVEKADQRACALFALEMLITQASLYSFSDNVSGTLKRTADDLGVDLKKVRAAFIGERAERQKQDKAKQSKKH